jgi:hypothetical protein
MLIVPFGHRVQLPVCVENVWRNKCSEAKLFLLLLCTIDNFPRTYPTLTARSGGNPVSLI